MDTRGKVLVAKLGLDGHDRGARLITRLLMDGGFEVVYTGLRQSPEGVVAAAVEEDVDVIGISTLSGAHLGIARELMPRVQEAELSSAVVFGGVVPDADRERLSELGVAAVVGAETPVDNVLKTFDALVEGRRAAF
jgi:methylmalonyl-CoA mutase C-terminal domain/subunit